MYIEKLNIGKLNIDSTFIAYLQLHLVTCKLPLLQGKVVVPSQ